MTIQNIHAENSIIGSNMATCISYVSPIQFGAFICDGKYRKKDDLFTATGLLSKIYFGDATLFKRKDNMPSRRCLYRLYAGGDEGQSNLSTLWFSVVQSKYVMDLFA